MKKLLESKPRTGSPSYLSIHHHSKGIEMGSQIKADPTCQNNRSSITTSQAAVSTVPGVQTHSCQSPLPTIDALAI
jgi:hypothetical protein